MPSKKVVEFSSRNSRASGPAGTARARCGPGARRVSFLSGSGGFSGVSGASQPSRRVPATNFQVLIFCSLPLASTITSGPDAGGSAADAPIQIEAPTTPTTTPTTRLHQLMAYVPLDDARPNRFPSIVGGV